MDKRDDKEMPKGVDRRALVEVLQATLRDLTNAAPSPAENEKNQAAKARISELLSKLETSEEKMRREQSSGPERKGL